jgi:hypothetical protein
MSRFTLVAATALAAALIAPATTLGGGWATVGLSSLPEGTAPGEPWVVDITVLQHGRTPLEGVHPRVLLAPTGAGSDRAFAAKATKRPGIYRAQVRLPSAGEWTYSVDDGFSQVHELGTVRIGADGEVMAPAPAKPQETAAPKEPPAAPTASDGGISVVAALGIAAGAGLLAALGAAGLRRRSAPKPAEG